MGMAIGYAFFGDEDVGLAIDTGNNVPGPGDPDPDGDGETERGYTGDPTDAWGTGEGYEVERKGDTEDGDGDEEY